MKNKFDAILTGSILGLLVPALSFLLFYLFSSHGINIFDKDIQMKIFSMCVIPNLLLFYLFIRRSYFKSARGVLLATILYTIAVFIFKFI